MKNNIIKDKLNTQLEKKAIKASSSIDENSNVIIKEDEAIVSATINQNITNNTGSIKTKSVGKQPKTPEVNAGLQIVVANTNQESELKVADIVNDNSLVPAEEQLRVEEIPANTVIAVRSLREPAVKAYNKFDLFCIKLWSYMVAFVVSVANGINWCIKGICKKKAPDKYVRAFVAAVLIVLLMILVTLPFKINIQSKETTEIFSEGLLPVSEKIYVDDMPQYKWGYIDKNGNVKIAAIYEDALPFMHGVAWVRIVNRNEKGAKVEDYWKLIGKNGKDIGKDGIRFYSVPEMERPIGEFDKNSELAWVYSAGSYGYIKTNGRYAVTPRFKYAEPFVDGVARVRMGSVEYYIDNEGRNKSAYYEEVKTFSEGLGAVKLNGSWGFVNNKGDMIIEPQYDNITSFYGGYAAVRNGLSYGIINKDDERIVELSRFTDLKPLNRKFMELIDSIRLDR